MHAQFITRQTADNFARKMSTKLLCTTYVGVRSQPGDAFGVWYHYPEGTECKTILAKYRNGFAK